MRTAGQNQQAQRDREESHALKERRFPHAFPSDGPARHLDPICCSSGDVDSDLLNDVVTLTRGDKAEVCNAIWGEKLLAFDDVEVPLTTASGQLVWHYDAHSATGFRDDDHLFDERRPDVPNRDKRK